MWQRHELSYCSNLHPGESLDAVLKNIQRYFVPVRKARDLQYMSSGLWLSAAAVKDLQDQTAKTQFRQTLHEAGLRLTSLNGFPFGNFHGDVVKQSVYQPNWSERARLVYSQQLAQLLAYCLPEDETMGSISTLPIGYAQDVNHQVKQQAIDHLLQMEHYLSQLHQQSGKKILLCLEMEPDCVLEHTKQLLDFFAELAKQLGQKPEYLGICFDICHQGVMFENITQSLTSILAAGIQIGKIQVSNAIEVDLAEGCSTDELQQVLQPFAQDKFLHQVKAPVPGQATSIGATPSSAPSIPLHTASDLCLALQDLNNATSVLNTADTARIHFHIPLHTRQFISPLISSLHAELDATLQFLADVKNRHAHSEFKPHLEVETYTWQVLPEEMQPKTDQQLIIGIKNELVWLETALDKQQLIQGGLP